MKLPVSGRSGSVANTTVEHDDDERRILSQSGSHLLNLPAELLDFVLSCLSPKDLDAVVYSCRHLYIRGTNDRLWQPLVQENIPGCILESPSPCSSYRSLYRAHDPHWFVPKMKIWFGDQHLFGRIMITYYNPYLGTIDGYRLVAERAPTIEYPWEHDPNVIIVSFKPNVRLHTDIPLLRLEALNPNGDSSPTSGSTSHRLDFEIPMSLSDLTDTIAQSTFMLARPAETHPNSYVWPPVTIPAKQRVISLSKDILAGHRRVSALVQMMTFNQTFTGAQKPRNRKEINEEAFRIRHWMHTVPGHRGEPLQISTYATLDPALYTPTETRPFRGIWVGDYSAHGCEFILLNQPDVEEPFDDATIIKQSDESQEQFLARKKDAQIYRGRLEAIKLTGDPNIPRGEYTFIAEDIGDEGLVRIAKEHQFKGARIVKSKGQLANRNFVNPEYFESELILISPDRIAHYWKSLGLICFHERVKLDDFIIPNPKIDKAD
ncbi:hypothetical protein V502_00778 [Pseudogymnoascus sp. VKM F-4520 (FW-2644)]|nr:hypothetical protein V502_00778 [Pseudogymnoascus sp. VKM F-4520 (FW-2644)]